MTRHRVSILAAYLGGAFIVTGCGAPETPSAPAAASRASSSGDGTSATRARIAQMYEGYRKGAFPDVDDIEVVDLPGDRDEAMVLLVDCREDRERDVSVIRGAISRAEFETDPARYADRLIVPYCTIGYRSGLYTQSLEKRGFEAKNLIGGVLAWAHEGRPFVDAKGNPVERVHVYGARWDLLPPGYESVYEGKPPP